MIHNKRTIAGLNLQGLRYLVVGSGFYGATMAERIAADKGRKVAVIERRNHIGGNSYSEIEPRTGIECHRYGSHIFHTKAETVWRYITEFASFNNYRHKVLSSYEGKLYQIPINLATINSFYGLNLNSHQARQFISSETAREKPGQSDNLEGLALSIIGKPLYDAFIRDYTAKQWGVDPRCLPAQIIKRIPVRFDLNSEYFEDPWQGIPSDGYGSLFTAMLSHENIDTYLGIDFFEIRNEVPQDCLVVFSGSIDRFFDYRFGRLKWRSLRFEREILPLGDYQGNAVVNFPEPTVPFTRIHEYRHYHKERNYPDDRTVIDREYPIPYSESVEPYYPVNTEEDRRVHQLYLREQKSTPNVVFGGRRGSYAYVNMDQTILDALHDYDELVKNRSE